MGLIDNDFELHMNASSDEEDDIFPQQSIFNKLNKQSQSYPEHEEDQNSEIAMNTNASQIYGNSKLDYYDNYII